MTSKGQVTVPKAVREALGIKTGDEVVFRVEVAAETVYLLESFYEALPLVRFPVATFMPRAFELRADVTAYDACYVALAEALGCLLLTADARLAGAPTITCAVEVLHD